MEKSNPPASDGESAFEQSLSNAQPGKLFLQLFIAGNTPRSQLAIAGLRRLIEERLDGNYTLEVIDIYQQPELARKQQIVAIPTLVKYLPQPKKIMVGDLSRTERVLACLGLFA